ncbi:MAG: hypothetical protein M3083_07795 [Actinomycetota bacterium]|nr:hypothetical protein [Actinomycetota bacterium]
MAAQLQAADRAAAGWARTLAVHQPHLVEAEAHQARRQQWLESHAGDLERHAALRAAAATRRANLTAAATLKPLGWLLEALGPYPDNRADRRIWREAAGDILAWRERHDVNDQGHPLGPNPADTLEALIYRQLTGRIRDDARRLGHTRAPNTAGVSASNEISGSVWGSRAVSRKSARVLAIASAVWENYRVVVVVFHFPGGFHVGSG